MTDGIPTCRPKTAFAPRYLRETRPGASPSQYCLSAPELYSPTGKNGDIKSQEFKNGTINSQEKSDSIPSIALRLA